MVRMMVMLSIRTILYVYVTAKDCSLVWADCDLCTISSGVDGAFVRTDCRPGV